MNGIATETPNRYRRFGVPPPRFGRDVEAVYEISASSLRHDGPHVLSFGTDRWCEHCGPKITNPHPERDPVSRAGARVSEANRALYETAIKQEIEECIKTL